MSISIAVGVDLALSLLENAARISAIVRQAQAAGQEKFTSEQWDSITDLDDAAKVKLENAISAADRQEIISGTPEVS
jgi:hypothetical protein